MKKILSFCILISALMLSGNAQTYLLNEGFENGLPAAWGNIDQDGDGFSWEVLTYDEDMIDAHTGNGCVTSVSFDNDSEEALTPTNYLVTPALALPAGLNNDNRLTLSWWVAAQDPDYPEDYYEVRVSSSGNSAADFASAPVFAETLTSDTWAMHTIDLSSYSSYSTIYIAFIHTNCTDEFMIKLDDISVYYFTEATIATTPAAVDFGTLAVGTTSAVTQINIASAMLGGNITATCDAPFEISTDNYNFGASQTVTANTNTALLVRYSPTAIGQHNGTLTLTSGNTSTTLTLTGAAISCDDILQLPFTENFESNISPCWGNLDRDNDGMSWGWYNDGFGHESNGYYLSFSYDEETWEDVMPNDWLITPKMSIPAEGAHINWWVAAYDEDFPANSYDVMVSESLDPANFTVIYSETTTTSTFQQRYAPLTDYAGRDIYIAFVHNTNTQANEDSYGLAIDDIAVEAGVGIAEQTATSAVTVFPNPATTLLNVQADGFDRYKLVNAMGQIVDNGTLSDGTNQINVAGLSNGVYFIQLSNGKSVENVRFIKKD